MSASNTDLKSQACCFNPLKPCQKWQSHKVSVFELKAEIGQLLCLSIRVSVIN